MDDIYNASNPQVGLYKNDDVFGYTKYTLSKNRIDRLWKRCFPCEIVNVVDLNPVNNVSSCLGRQLKGTKYYMFCVYNGPLNTYESP